MSSWPLLLAGVPGAAAGSDGSHFAGDTDVSFAFTMLVSRTSKYLGLHGITGKAKN